MVVLRSAPVMPTSAIAAGGGRATPRDSQRRAPTGDPPPGRTSAVARQSVERQLTDDRRSSVCRRRRRCSGWPSAPTPRIGDKKRARGDLRATGSARWPTWTRSVPIAVIRFGRPSSRRASLDPPAPIATNRLPWPWPVDAETCAPDPRIRDYCSDSGARGTKMLMARSAERRRSRCIAIAGTAGSAVDQRRLLRSRQRTRQIRRKARQSASERRSVLTNRTRSEVDQIIEEADDGVERSAGRRHSATHHRRVDVHRSSSKKMEGSGRQRSGLRPSTSEEQQKNGLRRR